MKKLLKVATAGAVVTAVARSREQKKNGYVASSSPLRSYRVNAALHRAVDVAARVAKSAINTVTR